MALTLVTLVLAASLAVTLGAIATTRLGEERVRANQLAQEQVERLKAIPWLSLGMFPTDSGYDADPACDQAGGESRALVTAPRPALTPSPVTTVNRGGLNYTMSTCVTWRTGATYDYKHVIVVVSWTDKTPRSISVSALRAPTAAEVPPPSSGTPPDSLALHPTATPLSQTLGLQGDLTSPITLSVTTPTAASTVNVEYDTQAGHQTAVLTSSDGLTWSLQVTSGRFNAGAETFSFTAWSNGAPATGSVTVTLTAPAPPALTLTVTAAPASQTLTSDGYLPAAIGVTATTNVAASSVTVSYATRAGTQTQPLSPAGSQTSWAYTFPTTSGPYNAGTETYTFTATPAAGGSQATQSVSVALAAPPARRSSSTRPLPQSPHRIVPACV